MIFYTCFLKGKKRANHQLLVTNALPPPYLDLFGPVSLELEQSAGSQIFECQVNHRVI